MDIEVYENIKTSLKTYFEKQNLTKSYKPNVVGFEPSNPTYPMVVFSEVRNIPVEGYRGSLQTVANLGYKFDIYAKQPTGGTTKQEIARTLAKQCDEFARHYVGLQQVSWNEFPNDGVNGALYHIIIMYSSNYYEQRLKFI